jgi:ribonuclease HI
VTTPPPRRAYGVRDLEEFRTAMAALRAELNPPTEVGDYMAHSDGACLGNPEGPGGWAAVVDAAAAERWPPQWLLFGHLSSTSNNRAEALGVLGAVEWIPSGSRLALHSDSELTVRILEGRYKAKANPDIWEVIRATIAAKNLTVSAEWLRGHAGDPLNELADRLSKLGAYNKGLAELDIVDGAASAPSASVPSELAGLEPLGDWERDFLSSVADQLRRRRPLSPKQQAVIDRIRARRIKS